MAVAPSAQHSAGSVSLERGACGLCRFGARPKLHGSDWPALRNRTRRHSGRGNRSHLSPPSSLACFESVIRIGQSAKACGSSSAEWIRRRPRLLPVLCHGFADKIDCLQVAEAGAFHSLLFPFRVSEFRHTLGFISVAKRSSSPIHMHHRSRPWKSVINAPQARAARILT